MNRQTMIALAVAVVLGLFAVFIANSYITGREQKADLTGTTKVAVAAVPLAYGTDITPDKIKFVDYPKASLPPGSFTNAAQLLPEGKKRFALMTIAVNEPVLASKISGEGQGASIGETSKVAVRASFGVPSEFLASWSMAMTRTFCKRTSVTCASRFASDTWRVINTSTESFG